METPGPGGREIRQLARYQVRPETLEKCLTAIHEFVTYVRAREPGTLRYEVWQEEEDPTRFVHIFLFRDPEADRIHSESAEVQKFASVLYPSCLAPVEFVNYRHVVSKI
jgi:quinol monooxygenase YgiN